MQVAIGKRLQSGRALRPLGVLAALWALAVLPQSTAATMVPDGLSIKETAAGQTLLDERGFVLYTFERDGPDGTSRCINECAELWPALLKDDARSTMPEHWSVHERADGALQWVFRGKPLYRFSKDIEPGVALGDRIGRVWRIAFIPLATPPGISVRSVFRGRVLVDARGRTLYWHTGELSGSRDVFHCVDECLREWIPVIAPRLAQTWGDFTPVDRPEGLRQWTYQGRPLYQSSRDHLPGEILGETQTTLISRQTWQAAILEAALPPPDWVTVQNADMGEVYANREGFTLYTLSGSLERIRNLICMDECIARHWRLVPAESEDQPVGEWTLIPSPLDASVTVWAYKGDAVYTHTRDRGPGAVSGDKWAAGSGGLGGGWNPVLRRRDHEL
jgi:predicted lipoprotein with Yx(FWY)xxD motif